MSNVAGVRRCCPASSTCGTYEVWSGVQQLAYVVPRCTTVYGVVGARRCTSGLHSLGPGEPVYHSVRCRWSVVYGVVGPGRCLLLVILPVPRLLGWATPTLYISYQTVRSGTVSQLCTEWYTVVGVRRVAQCTECTAGVRCREYTECTVYGVGVVGVCSVYWATPVLVLILGYACLVHYWATPY